MTLRKEEDWGWCRSVRHLDIWNIPFATDTSSFTNTKTGDMNCDVSQRGNNFFLRSGMYHWHIGRSFDFNTLGGITWDH